MNNPVRLFPVHGPDIEGFHPIVDMLGVAGDGDRLGKKLPGRMGGERVTVQRLTVVRVDADRNLILIKGAIPGPKKGFVVIKDTVKPAKAAKE